MPLDDVGLQVSHLYPQEADLGYAIMPQAQGSGVTSEAVRVVCQYAFEHVDMTTINVYALTNNKDSIRIPERTGFVHTQVLEKAYEIGDIVYDDRVFRLKHDTLKL